MHLFENIRALPEEEQYNRLIWALNVLNTVTYHFYEQMLAEEFESALLSRNPDGLVNLRVLKTQQDSIPSGRVPEDDQWVAWVAATNPNWQIFSWRALKACKKICKSFSGPHYSKVGRNAWHELYSNLNVHRHHRPRPRRPGNTPFPPDPW